MITLHLLATRSLSLQVYKLHRGVMFDEVNNSRADMGSVMISATDVTATGCQHCTCNLKYVQYFRVSVDVYCLQGDKKPQGLWEMWSYFYKTHWK